MLLFRLSPVPVPSSGSAGCEMPRVGNVPQSGGSVLRTSAGLSRFAAGLGCQKGGRQRWDEVLRDCMKELGVSVSSGKGQHQRNWKYFDTGGRAQWQRVTLGQ